MAMFESFLPIQLIKPETLWGALFYAVILVTGAWLGTDQKAPQGAEGGGLSRNPVGEFERGLEPHGVV